MCIRATLDALKLNLPASPKHVLTVLAIRKNNETGCCNPSIPTICQDTGLSRKTVITALRYLKHIGLLEVASGHTGKSNRYTLTITGEPVVDLLLPQWQYYSSKGKLKETIPYIYSTSMQNPTDYSTITDIETGEIINLFEARQERARYAA
jgi:DNA-binding transcriptional MocR family regulator